MPLNLQSVRLDKLRNLLADPDTSLVITSQISLELQRRNSLASIALLDEAASKLRQLLHLRRRKQKKNPEAWSHLPKRSHLTTLRKLYLAEIARLEKLVAQASEAKQSMVHLQNRSKELRNILDDYVDEAVPSPKIGYEQRSYTLEAARLTFVQNLQEQVTRSWPRLPEFRRVQSALETITDRIEATNIQIKNIRSSSLNLKNEINIIDVTLKRIKEASALQRERSATEREERAIRDRKDRERNAKLQRELDDENQLVILAAHALAANRDRLVIIRELSDNGASDPADILYRATIYYKNVLRP